MVFRACLAFWLFFGTACSAGILGSNAVDSNSNGVSNRTLDGDETSSGNKSGEVQDPAPEAPAPAYLPLSGGTAPGSPSNSNAYYYLPPGNAPRIASASGGGVLSAPTDDDQVHVHCPEVASLETTDIPSETILSQFDTVWTVLNGKTLRRTLLVRLNGDAVPTNLQVRVYHAVPEEQRVSFRDYLFPQLDSQGQKLEIVIENPRDGDEVKVFIPAPPASSNPQDRISKECAQFRFEGFSEEWTTGSYEEFARGPQKRIFVNQIGSFLIDTLAAKGPRLPRLPSVRVR